MTAFRRFSLLLVCFLLLSPQAATASSPLPAATMEDVQLIGNTAEDYAALAQALKAEAVTHLIVYTIPRHLQNDAVQAHFSAMEAALLAQGMTALYRPVPDPQAPAPVMTALALRDDLVTLGQYELPEKTLATWTTLCCLEPGLLAAAQDLSIVFVPLLSDLTCPHGEGPAAL